MSNYLNQILKFSTDLDICCNLRKKRKEKKAALIYHYAHRINGDRLALNGQESRANYCCDQLDKERKKLYKIRDKLFHETLALKEEIKALKEKNAHLQAQIRCLEAPTPV